MRNPIGGCPTCSWKRRANAARETPATSASPATVHGCSGWCCISRSGGPTTGSACAVLPPGGRAPGRSNHARSTAISSRSSSRSSTACWPGASRTSRAPSRSTSGPSTSSPRSTTTVGQRAQQPGPTSPSTAYAPVSSTVSPTAALPQLRTPWCISSASSRPSGVRQTWPGWITAWTGVAGSSAIDGVRRARAAAEHRQVTRREPDRLAARPGAARRGRGPPRSPRAARRRAGSTDHGGSSRQRSRNAPRARGPSSSPESSSIGRDRRRMTHAFGVLRHGSSRRPAVDWTHDRCPRALRTPPPPRRPGRQRPPGRHLLHLGQRRDARPGRHRRRDVRRRDAARQRRDREPGVPATFLGAPVLAAAGVAAAGGPARPWAIAGLVLAIGTVVVTAAGNIPLNDALAAVDLHVDGRDLAAARDASRVRGCAGTSCARSPPPAPWPAWAGRSRASGRPAGGQRVELAAAGRPCRSRGRRRSRAPRPPWSGVRRRR